ncbi:hypothetical protein Hypma_003341 [Hypsizygus marmoreus]|uniref:Uncharacterized protein n=1 Tax=Hypsizygus marmoreus TaxID=39966 RepID=A0A369JBE0_HYPMA|nr:hypothetical protein Hypma_003341 [Hypsizygus marmoreus]
MAVFVVLLVADAGATASHRRASRGAGGTTWTSGNHLSDVVKTYREDPGVNAEGASREDAGVAALASGVIIS